MNELIREERLKVHQDQQHMVNPQAHLKNWRDANHFEFAKQAFTEPSRILDIGCYDSWLDFLLIEQGHSVLGIELRDELVLSARIYAHEHKISSTRYRIRQGFWDEISMIEEDPFDAVIAFEVLEHMPLETMDLTIRKAEQCLNKNGLMLVSLPVQDKNKNAQHLWSPSQNLVISLWGHKSGFSMVLHSFFGTDVPDSLLISWRVS